MALSFPSLPTWLPQTKGKADTEGASSLMGTLLAGFANYLTKGASGAATGAAAAASAAATDPATMGEAGALAEKDATEAAASEAGASGVAAKSATTGPSAPAATKGGLNKWKDSFNEARLNQQNPLWRLSTAKTQAETWNTVASTELQTQRFQANATESANKTADMPRLNAAIAGLKTNPNWTPEPMDPTRPETGPFQSQWAVQQFDQMSKQAQQADFARQNLSIKQQNEKTAVERKRTLTQWDNSLAAADPEIQSHIDGLPNAGYNVDADGNRLSPSREALTHYNQAITRNGQFPERAFGFKANAIETAKARGEEQLTLEEKRQARAQSPLGKLEADKQAALKSGAPAEVIAAYDGAIKKASAADGLYDGSPEVIEAGGKQFLKWGKQLRDISGQDLQKKAQLSILQSKIKTLQSAVIKYEDTPEKQAAPGSLSGQLKTATDELKKLFETLPAAPSLPGLSSRAVPAAKPAAPAPAVADASPDPLGIMR